MNTAAGPSWAEAFGRRPGATPGWLRLIFPGVFLVYLGQTVHGIAQHSSGGAAVAGYVVLAIFCAGYLLALSAKWRYPPLTFPQREFWLYYSLLLVACAAETLFAHEDAFVMFVYIAVLTISALGWRAVPIVAALTAVAAFVPAAVPAWHTGVDTNAAFSIPVVSLAMFGFFGVVSANRALMHARTEVARLAAENERNRIARDLHDLLGHSLTTITVKAGLARRLALRDPGRAATEMGEVEALARRSLGDVRAAVASYRDVTLTGELATGRELLRVAGVSAHIPLATDVVEPPYHELFGWVVRERLTNVVRHARATECRVGLGPKWVEIVDNCMGDANHDPGSGLAGLRERVHAAGGTLTAGPVAPVGWRLRVDMPSSRAVVPPTPRQDVPVRL